MEDVRSSRTARPVAHGTSPARIAPDPAPCVVLAHGFDGVREQRSESTRCASPTRASRRSCSTTATSATARASRASCSATAPARGLACGDRVRSARRCPGVDPNRIALWGTSTSAGHVVEVAAEDARIAAVVRPDAVHQRLCAVPQHADHAERARFVWAGVRTRSGRGSGSRAALIPAAGRPHTLAVTTSRDALSGLCTDHARADSTWRNGVLRALRAHHDALPAGPAAKRLRCPLLVCIADGDRVDPRRSRRSRWPSTPSRHAAPLRLRPLRHVLRRRASKRVVADQVAFLRRASRERRHAWRLAR